VNSENDIEVKKNIMFTGIIEEIGTIKAIQHGNKSVCLTIGAEKLLEDMKIGDSINTNGVCLTVVSFNKGAFSADAMPETMRRTTLGTLNVGDKVNLERAMKLTDRLGGHIVSGHIDGVGLIQRLWEEDNAVWFTISPDKAILKYIAEKGSVAIDGISLTIARVDNISFDVSVIPHTLRVTTLVNKRTGNGVNVECDLIAKYLEKVAGYNKEKGNITLEFLSEQGFV
jgi:riboflavin synthase